MPAIMPVDTRPLHPAPIITGHDNLGRDAHYRRPQGLDHHLLVLTLGGNVDLGPAGGKFPLRAGDLILVEPHHAIDQDTSPDATWPRIWVIFSPRAHWHDWLDWPQLAPGYLHVKLDSTRRGSPVRDHLEAMHVHATGTLRHGPDLAMNALEAALLWCDEHNPRGASAKLDVRVRRALEFISRNIQRRLTLTEIADSAGLSTPHLTRLFRAQLQTSPIQYLENSRMQRACALLQMSARSIADIALQVGFDDPFYFSTRFKRFAGVGPRAYRRAKTFSNPEF